MTRFAESVVEDATLALLESIGWRIAHGPYDTAPYLPATEPQNSGGGTGGTANQRSAVA